MSPTKDNPNHSHPPRNVPDVNHHRDRPDPIENLLEQIKTQHQTHPIPPNTPPIDHDPFQHLRPQQQTKPNPDPDPIEQTLQQLKTQRSQPQPSNPNEETDLLNQLQQLKNLKQQQQTQTTTPTNLRQNLDEIRLIEQRQQQQKKQAIAQAQHWLKQLDPYSDEGLWFDQFAESYSDRLDAALDYLKALKS